MGTSTKLDVTEPKNARPIDDGINTSPSPPWPPPALGFAASHFCRDSFQFPLLTFLFLQGNVSIYVSHRYFMFFSLCCLHENNALSQKILISTLYALLRLWNLAYRFSYSHIVTDSLGFVPFIVTTIHASKQNGLTKAIDILHCTKA